MKTENCDSYSAKSMSRNYNKNFYMNSNDQSVNSLNHGKSGVIRNVDTEETPPPRPNATSRITKQSNNAIRMF